jgi:hypothetical protein
MKRKPSRLAQELVETADDMHRLGILDRPTYEKIIIRHLGRRPCNNRSDPMSRAPDSSGADAMTDEEIHAAALADLDARPLTRERLARMRRTPQVRIIRALGPVQPITSPS